MVSVRSVFLVRVDVVRWVLHIRVAASRSTDDLTLLIPNFSADVDVRVA
jgi:hypothetical protein